ncbi:colicin E1 family microcin immunity protein [Pseudomonas sp. R9.37]|uniref:colicin E1 family microcin immunity protein n=1 Tax=Pseudomonas sp. R9.37 TaxID=1390498 RepID=UPI0013047FF9|nr:colicin E1 family microcin immunity protein [Pseudomonas sp. R9.37]
MKKAYYLKNLLISSAILGLGTTIWLSTESAYENANLYYIFVAILSTLLFPLSRMITEKTALRFSTRNFWSTGLFTESPGKNGLYVLYYFFCLIIAIPAGGAYLLHIIKKKRPN